MLAIAKPHDTLEYLKPHSSTVVILTSSIDMVNKNLETEKLVFDKDYRDWLEKQEVITKPFTSIYDGNAPYLHYLFGNGKENDKNHLAIQGDGVIQAMIRKPKLRLLSSMLRRQMLMGDLEKFVKFVNNHYNYHEITGMLKINIYVRKPEHILPDITSINRTRVYEIGSGYLEFADNMLKEIESELL